MELADALGIDRFGVVGWSGGAPYAAAVAAELHPGRLTGVCLASSASIAYAVGPSQADDEDLHISELIDRFGPAEATVRAPRRSRPGLRACGRIRDHDRSG